MYVIEVQIHGEWIEMCWHDDWDEFQECLLSEARLRGKDNVRWFKSERRIAA